MSSLATLLRRLPGRNVLIRLPGAQRAARWVEGLSVKGRSPRDVFTAFYEKNHWADASSVSGAGSSRQQTAVIARALPSLLRDLGATSLLDVPCGDFHWMSDVDLGSIDYIGVDIVEPVIEANKRYETEKRRFLCLDLIQDKLPRADAVLVRDCLVHFSYAHIRAALKTLRESGSTYLLTTTFPERAENIDIHTGQWRPLNLMCAPFGFPEPLVIVNEGSTEWDGAFKDKSIGVWRIADLPALTED